MFATHARRCGAIAALTLALAGGSGAQGFDPLPDQAAVLVISAHPDDEGIFFGGALPYYSRVRNLPTVLISATSGDYALAPEVREQEMRNAAAIYGVQYEPLFPRFRDYWFGTGPDGTNRTFDLWNDGVLDNGDAAQGRVKTANYLATQIRRLRPEVVLGHDLEGEYGHGNHRALALATADAWAIAGDASVILLDEQGLALAPWTPSKMYLHLYDEQPGNLGSLFHLGWETDLPELGNRSARDIANLALDEHITQGRPNVATIFENGEVNASWDPSDSERWGLFATRVGLESQTAPPPGWGLEGLGLGEAHYGDFFENVDLTPFAHYLADTNRDGQVDETDLSTLLSHWGTEVPLGSVSRGDANGDGVVGPGDLRLLLTGWTSAAAPSTTIPEPGTLGLLLPGLAGLLRRRR